MRGLGLLPLALSSAALCATILAADVPATAAPDEDVERLVNQIEDVRRQLHAAGQDAALATSRDNASDVRAAEQRAEQARERLGGLKNQLWDLVRVKVTELRAQVGELDENFLRNRHREIAEIARRASQLRTLDLDPADVERLLRERPIPREVPNRILTASERELVTNLYRDWEEHDEVDYSLVAEGGQPQVTRKPNVVVPDQVVEYEVERRRLAIDLGRVEEIQALIIRERAGETEGLFTLRFRADPPRRVDMGRGVPRPGFFVQRYDANHDGFITREEYTGPDDVFRGLDPDRDNRISREEADLLRAPSPIGRTDIPEPESGDIYWYMTYTITNVDDVEHHFSLDISATSDGGVTYRDGYHPLAQEWVEFLVGMAGSERLASHVDVTWTGQLDDTSGRFPRAIQMPVIRAGETKRCVAIFRRLDEEMDRLTVSVRGLTNDQRLRMNHRNWDDPRSPRPLPWYAERDPAHQPLIEQDDSSVAAHRRFARERVLLLEYARLGDEFATSVDRIRFVASRWEDVETEIPSDRP